MVRHVAHIEISGAGDVVDAPRCDVVPVETENIDRGFEREVIAHPLGDDGARSWLSWTRADPASLISRGCSCRIPLQVVASSCSCRRMRCRPNCRQDRQSCRRQLAPVNMPWLGVQMDCGPVSSSPGRNRLGAYDDREVLVHPRLPHGFGAGDRGRRLITVQIETDRSGRPGHPSAWGTRWAMPGAGSSSRRSSSSGHSGWPAHSTFPARGGAVCDVLTRLPTLAPSAARAGRSAPPMPRTSALGRRPSVGTGSRAGRGSGSR